MSFLGPRHIIAFLHKNNNNNNKKYIFTSALVKDEYNSGWIILLFFFFFWFEKNQNMFPYSCKSSTGPQHCVSGAQWVLPIVWRAMKETGWKQQWRSNIYLTYLLALSRWCVRGRRNNSFQKWGWGCCLMAKDSSRRPRERIQREEGWNWVRLRWYGQMGMKILVMVDDMDSGGEGYTDVRLGALEQSWVVSKWVGGPRELYCGNSAHWNTYCNLRENVSSGCDDLWSDWEGADFKWSTFHALSHVILMTYNNPFYSGAVREIEK